MKRTIVFILLLSLIMCISGCSGKDKKKSLFDVQQIEDDDLVSVEDFKEFYGVDVSVIPNSYIDIYINHFNITMSKMERYSNWNYYEHMKIDYEAGTVYEYSPDTRLKIKTFLSNVDPQEFMDHYQYVFIDFEHLLPISKTSVLEIMCIDFDHMKIYFAGDYLDINDEENIMAAQLTDEDKATIREGILEHVNFDAPNTRRLDTDSYTFTIWIVSDERECVKLSGTDLDEIGFPGFTKYWKDLYKQYFGTDYVFNYVDTAEEE
ncbi:MAG: hypothetical protein IKP88_04345 [Lachnospiraceae bacterium]|nr:hypothetical protein [Lachnospiraceae bacterium]